MAKQKKPINTQDQQDKEMIRDVEESLRQEQLQKLWDDYGTMIVAAAVSVILLTAIVSGWNNWQAHKNQERTSGLIEAMNSGDVDMALSEYTQNNKGAHKAIALLERAGQARTDGNMDLAKDLYKELSQDKKVTVVYRDLGTLLYATTSDDLSLLEAIALKETSPWQAHAAVEWAVYLDSKGHTDEAITALNTIVGKETAALGLQKKAKSLVALYTIKMSKTEEK